MKIQELLDGIRKKDLVLPEFQREYVWSLEQAKQLRLYADLWGQIRHHHTPQEPVDGSCRSSGSRKPG